MVIEAIRDFAGSRQTPIFQAYVSHTPFSYESRLHGIYAQLGVTFINCYNTGKDTADKKIISDMWKFYATFQKSCPNQRIRIILITGDRDFADAIGQSRNLGVEVGILTGPRFTTAPVFDDYTLGMRVLPLFGVVQARARHTDVKAFQTSKKYVNGFQNRLPELDNADYVDAVGGDSMNTEDESLPDRSSTDCKADKTTVLKEQSLKSQANSPKSVREAKQVSLKEVPLTPATTGDGEITDAKTLEAKITPSALTKSDTKLKAKREDFIALSSTPISQASSRSEDTNQSLSNSSGIAEKPKTTAIDNPAPSGRIGQVLPFLSNKTEQSNQEAPQSSSMFSKLRNFFGLSPEESNTTIPDTATPASRTSESSSTASTSSSSISETLSSPTTTGTSATVCQSQKPIIRPTEISAVDAVLSSLPLNLCISPTPMPISESIYSAVRQVPPNIRKIRKCPAKNQSILEIPPSSCRNPTELRNHYMHQVKKYKPAGMSDPEIEGIWNAWMEILSWSGDQVNASSIRRAATLALSSAVDVMNLRKGEKEAKEVERYFMEGRDVVQADDQQEKGYALTGVFAEVQSGVREHGVVKGDFGSWDKSLEEKKPKTTSEDVKLNHKSADEGMDDKQLTMAKSGDSSLGDSLENGGSQAERLPNQDAPTTAFEYTNTASKQATAKKEPTISAPTESSHSSLIPAAEPSLLEQTPLASASVNLTQNADQWIVPNKEQTQENVAIPN